MTFTKVFQAEVAKARSVSSTFWTLGVAVGAGIAESVSSAQRAGESYDRLSAADRTDFDPTRVSLGGLSVTLLFLILFGQMVITSEYRSRLIGATLAAVPDRSRLLAAKALLVGLCALVAGLTAAVVSFLAGQWILAGEHLDVGPGSPGALALVARSAAVMPMVALIALAVGAMVRGPAATIAIMFGIFYAPAVATVLPMPAWMLDRVFAFLPGVATVNLIRGRDGGWIQSVAGGGVILAVWTIVLLAGAAYVMNRRDT